MKYWLMKSEPEVFGIEALKKEQTTWWEGVRNYQARNFMKEMAVGDLILFYHSNAEPSGVAGIAQVSKTAAADKTQFDKKSDYYDAKASKEKVIWECVEIEYVATCKKFVSLEEIKETKSLSEMLLIQRSRLSVQPVDKKHFDIIKKMGGFKP